MELGEEVKKKMDFKVIMDDAFILKEHLSKMGHSVISISMSNTSNTYDVFLSEVFYESIKGQFPGFTEYTKECITNKSYYEKGFIKDGIKYFCIVEGDINEL